MRAILITLVLTAAWVTLTWPDKHESVPIKCQMPENPTIYQPVIFTIFKDTIDMRGIKNLSYASKAKCQEQILDVIDGYAKYRGHEHFKNVKAVHGICYEDTLILDEAE